MDYAMVNKMEKAKAYAKDRERFTIQKFECSVNGANSAHLVSYDDGKWNCDCEFFQARGRCSHSMALEILLEDMVQIAYDEKE